MSKVNQRIAAALIAAAAGSSVFAWPASAAGMTQIGGDGVFDTSGQCAPAPTGFDDYAPIIMAGSLSGCWYTNVEDFRLTPSGAYIETGSEVFMGSVNGSAPGTFRTTYRFEATLDLATFTEVRGRCEHPIVSGSGTAGLAGIGGRVDMKDDVVNEVTHYRGHVTFS